VSNQKRPTEIALGIAAQAWCEPQSSGKVMDPELATAFATVVQRLVDGIEVAWGIIANAHGGDWASASPEWRSAATRWRNECWNRVLSGRQPREPASEFDALRDLIEEGEAVQAATSKRLADDLASLTAERDELQRQLERTFRTNEGQVVSPETDAERLLGCAHVALGLAVKWADRLHERCDNDENSKVGKGLMALAGYLPGYAPDTDGIHAFMREIAEYRSTRKAAE